MQPEMTLGHMIDRQTRLWRLKQEREGHESHPTTFVTISRQYGCDGYALARLISERAGNQSWPWLVYGRELLEQIAGDLGISKKIIAGLAEGQIGEIRDFLESAFHMHPGSIKVGKRLGETIRALALGGGVVIVGRGANYLTRDLTGGVHIRLVADVDWRIRNLVQSGKVNRDEARQKILAGDQARSSLISELFQRDIDDAGGYTAIFNNRLINLEQVADFALAMIRSMQDMNA